jgi:hypothetical protein
VLPLHGSGAIIPGGLIARVAGPNHPWGQDPDPLRHRHSVAVLLSGHSW